MLRLLAVRRDILVNVIIVETINLVTFFRIVAIETIRIERNTVRDVFEVATVTYQIMEILEVIVVVKVRNVKGKVDDRVQPRNVCLHDVL